MGVYRLMLVVVALLAGPTPLHAQEWPSRPVRIIVPVAAGSAGDIWARVIAPRLEQIWKQPVIVENKPGASTLIGTEYVVNAAPDGHTLLQVGQSYLWAKFTVKNMRFEPETALTPVYKFVNYKLVYATNAQTKIKSMPEMVEQSKDKGVFFGGIGATGSHNILNNIVAKQLGVRYSVVDYPGPAQVTMALIRNDVQYAMYTPNAYKSFFEAGTLQPLAVIGEVRYPELPNVPTVRELGFKGLLPQLWAGISAPKGTPMPIVEKVARDLESLVSDDTFRQELEGKIGGTLLRSSPAAFAAEQQQEFKLWADYFTAAGTKPE